MRKILFLSFALISTVTFAKKIKFSVDMDTNTVGVNGVRVTGDFQDEAGYGDDFNAEKAPVLTKESGTTIYSVVLNIPAFRVYEFRYIAGATGYDAEYVPDASRVLYKYNDNRWVYLDSLSNDTQIIKPVIFATNAPKGKYLLRFRVNMKNVPSIPKSGVHVAGNFQGWNAATTRMSKFHDTLTLYEYITYVDKGNSTFEHEYKFYNGNADSNKETVPGTCSNGKGNRNVFAINDLILPTVCFSECSECKPSSIDDYAAINSLFVYPNPSNGSFIISNLRNNSSVFVYDAVGKMVFTAQSTGQQKALHLDLPKGLYFLRTNNDNSSSSSKIVIE